MAVRTPTVADRAQVRVILRQNVGLMTAETDAGLTTARVLALLQSFTPLVHVDDATSVVDGVMLLHTSPEYWEAKVLFIFAGVGQVRFAQIWKDFETTYYTMAKAANVPKLIARHALPQAAGVKIIMDARVAKGGWNVEYQDSANKTMPSSVGASWVIYSGTPDVALAGL